MDDINKATFAREAERVLSDAGQRTKAIANFAKCGTPAERLDAFRKLHGGSLTAKHATKLGNSPHTS